jgi:hypothetical protein
MVPPAPGLSSDEQPANPVMSSVDAATQTVA